MPSLMFCPSSLAAPLNGAERPKRISLSVTPRKKFFGAPDSGARGCAGAGSTACCICEMDCCGCTGWTGRTGCCAGAYCCGSAIGTLPAAATAILFAGAGARSAEGEGCSGTTVVFAASRLVFGACPFPEYASNNPVANCDSGFAKMIKSATVAAKVTKSAMRPTNPPDPSSSRTGGSGTLCGPEWKSEIGGQS